VLKTLRGEGWFCSRSAASHSAVDVFACKDGQMLIIQVKSGSARMSAEDRLDLKRWALASGARAEVWFFNNRKLKREVISD